MSIRSQVTGPQPVAPSPQRADHAKDTERRWLGLLVVCLGVMMAFISVTATITSLGSIQQDLHISTHTLVWIPSAYSLAVVSLVMSAGTLGDLIGRRRVFVSGALVFAAGSLGAFLADSPAMLITAQAVMGAGGAAVLPTSLTIVSTTFVDPHERTTAISAWAACSGLGLAAGPLIAGALLEHYSWHSVFLTNLVIGAVAVALTPLVVRESKHPSRRLDPAGIVLGTLALASATYAIIQGGATGYTRTPILISYVVFALSLALFVRVELRHHDPMLDLRLFRSLPFTAVMGVAATTMFGFVGIALLSVLYMQRVTHTGPLGVGVRMLAMFAMFIAVSAIAPRLVRKTGFTALFTIGLALMGAGALLLLTVGPFDTYGAMWPGLLVAGAGSGLLVAPSTAAAVGSVPPLQAGMAASAVNMARQLGNVLGPSVLGTIVTSHFTTSLHERLLNADLPAPAADQIVAGAAHGGSATDLPAPAARIVADAVPRAFTDAMHLSLLIAAISLLTMAVAAVLLVHRRTQHPQM
ncbi:MULTISPECIES: MFS transporter [Streptomyces]|jgi:DHA2 family multidrug resistance protein-like MFS transporter|uniref:MFS transporter n=1 Tax=Streptomyces spinosisporus TaxID=2927582 RepID=A0ABS9XWK9_9ACTN|nr:MULTISPECIES: MFS transporter [Streptomyces]MCI3246461.1 MFS transporter [Streptomyces spinosisporus]WUB41307.1 MFS transporter [Streptomyces sp. NBC_00588]